MRLATPARTPRRSPSPSGRNWKPRRHQEILEAAFEAFAAKGYAATRLEDVAKRAGVAKGTIYLYFKNKEVLFRAVFRSLIQPVFEELETSLQKFPGSAEGLARKVLSRQYNEIVKNPKARAMFRLLIAESPKFPQLADVYFREVITPGVAALRLLLEKGIASGEFRPTKIVDYPQVLVGPAVLAVIWTLILGDRQQLDLDAYMEAHLDLLLHGLQNATNVATALSGGFLREGQHQGQKP
jgi:AcrR family transcriptional regulator